MFFPIDPYSLFLFCFARRRDGFEKQYRYHCPRKYSPQRYMMACLTESLILIEIFLPIFIGCELLIAYELKEERKSDHYTYLVDASLTDVQGTAPPSALLEPTVV